MDVVEGGELRGDAGIEEGGAGSQDRGGFKVLPGGGAEGVGAGEVSDGC